MTIALLRELPWYAALTIGAVFTASLLVMLLVIDYFWRLYTISKKVSVTQLRSVHTFLNPTTKRLSIQMAAHLQNFAFRPVFYQLKRVNCHIDKLTHDMSPDMSKPLEIQVANSGAIPIPIIEGLDPSRQQFQGRVELEFKYGKKEDNLKRTYKTTGAFTIYIFPTPFGNPVAHIEVTGATATYE
jgi:hypothetical protein